MKRQSGDRAITPEFPVDVIIRNLSQPCAFPTQPSSVTVLQTHISMVFLADDVVYKMKKPVLLPFLDFSTPQLRNHFCGEEIRINQPWAHDVYLGVVPVTFEAGRLRFEAEGRVVDWAVKMRRLPESATLRARWQAGHLDRTDLEHVAARIAAIHRQAERLTDKQALDANAAFHRFWTENWEFARTVSSEIIHPQVLVRLMALSAKWMERHEAMLIQRAVDGKIRDVHGDLRLEHVFVFPHRTPPADIVIIDGIEFSPQLRRIDVVADLAFLVMELSFLGRSDLARFVADAYFVESHDFCENAVLTLFTVYRSAVRAKVAATLASEPEIPLADRERAIARSRAHWLWCLSEMEDPDKRPALVLVSGLPGTGKSTLARLLATSADFEVIRSDVVRKEIFETETTNDPAQSMYATESTQRVYDECWTRAQNCLLSGGRVIVDATFQRECNRQRFLQLAIDCGIRAVWLECHVPAAIARARLEARQGDASDADWSVYLHVKRQWESASEFTKRFHVSIECSEDAHSSRNEALRILNDRELSDIAMSGALE